MVKEVGKIKQDLNLRIRDIKTERELRKEVLGLCDELGLNKRFASRVLSFIIEESVKVQKLQRASSRRQRKGKS